MNMVGTQFNGTAQMGEVNASLLNNRMHSPSHASNDIQPVIVMHGVHQRQRSPKTAPIESIITFG